MLHRSSRWQMLFKKGVLKNLVSFTGKHLCWSLTLLKLRTPLVAASDCLKSRAVTGKLFFFWNKMITQMSIKLHFIKVWRLPEIIRGSCFCLFLSKIISKNFTDISYLFEMLSRRWCHTEICLGYTKFYVLEK